MVWSHECSIIFAFYTSTSTRLLNEVLVVFYYHLNVGGVVIARQPKSPVTLFACNPKTTQQWEVEAMVHLLHALWLFVRLRVKERAK